MTYKILPFLFPRLGQILFFVYLYLVDYVQLRLFFKFLVVMMNDDAHNFTTSKTEYSRTSDAFQSVYQLGCRVNAMEGVSHNLRCFLECIFRYLVYCALYAHPYCMLNIFIRIFYPHFKTSFLEIQKIIKKNNHLKQTEKEIQQLMK